MKITASRIDEIRKAQEEWEAEDARRAEIHKKENARYSRAEDELIAPVDYEISRALKRFDKLDFEIDVRAGRHYGAHTGLEVRIQCNQRRVHDENSALSWDWTVSIDSEGNIVKDSGSWSGLNATTQENMDSLMQTYLALQYLNSVDWKSLIDVDLPKYNDYFTEEGYPQRNKPNFKQQLKEAELEEFIGTDKMLLGHSLPEYESRWNSSVPTWFIILGETPKQYKIGEVSRNQARYWFEENNYSIEQIVEQAKRYPSRIRKDRLMDTLEYPYVVLSEQTVVQNNR